MGGLPYDCLANPLGAVRYAFEKAAAAEGPGFDPAAFSGKDWGAVELFRKFLYEQDGFSQVPILRPDNLSRIQPNTLVRYKGMVQDMLNSEFYIGAFKDGETWRTNKYVDVPTFQTLPTSYTRLWERRLYYCVPVPGQNSWTLDSDNTQKMGETSRHGEKRRRDGGNNMMELDDCHEQSDLCVTSKKQKEDHIPSQLPLSSQKLGDTSMPHSYDANSLSCLVKIYDTRESDLKLNDVIEFIGIYTYDSELTVQEDDRDELSFDLMDDFLDHLPPIKVPRLHCIIHRKLLAEDFIQGPRIIEMTQDFIQGPRIIESSPNLIRGIRESLLRHLTTVLGNDGLAAHCLLLHLLSRVRSRGTSHAIGQLSLNFSGFTRESASIFGKQLATSLKCILPFSQVIPISIEYLNANGLQPRKDNHTGRLVPGALQLAEGTQLILDETYLNTGTLNPTGFENVRVLKHLLISQMVEYDFEFYKLDMPADVQLLILSEGKSNILPADVVVPFQPAAVSSIINTDPKELQAWRWYLATLKFLPHSIGPDMQEEMEDEWVAARKRDTSLQPEDFSRWLTMAEQMSASFGERYLSMEHWQMTKEMDRLRKERIKEMDRLRKERIH